MDATTGGKRVPRVPRAKPGAPRQQGPTRKKELGQISGEEGLIHALVDDARYTHATFLWRVCIATANVWVMSTLTGGVAFCLP